MSGAVTRFWWLRHGPVVAPKGLLYGAGEVPVVLTDSAALAWLAGSLPGGAAWVASPLGRARDTAAAVRALQGGGDSPLVLEPDFAEQDFGRWQGRFWDDLVTEPEYESYWRAPGATAPPGGESFADVMARVGGAVRRINERFSGQDVVICAHGGPIRAALAVALGIGPERALAVQVDTLSLTRLDHVAGGAFKSHPGSWRVCGVNLGPPNGGDSR